MTHRRQGESRKGNIETEKEFLEYGADSDYVPKETVHEYTYY